MPGTSSTDRETGSRAGSARRIARSNSCRAGLGSRPSSSTSTLPGVAVDGQGLALPARAVQRQHQLAAQALAIRVGGSPAPPARRPARRAGQGQGRPPGAPPAPPGGPPPGAAPRSAVAPPRRRRPAPVPATAPTPPSSVRPHPRGRRRWWPVERPRSVPQSSPSPARPARPAADIRTVGSSAPMPLRCRRGSGAGLGAAATHRPGPGSSRSTVTPRPTAGRPDGRWIPPGWRARAAPRAAPAASTPRDPAAGHRPTPQPAPGSETPYHQTLRSGRTLSGWRRCLQRVFPASCDRLPRQPILGLRTPPRAGASGTTRRAVVMPHHPEWHPGQG